MITIYHCVMLWLIFNEIIILWGLNMLKGDWRATRTHGEHLTEEEIARMRAAFEAGRRTEDIAEELRCSGRIANKYYAMFRGTPQKQGRPRNLMICTPRPPAPMPKKSRFYKSNFEI